MAYRHDTYKYKNKKIIEHEFKYAGRYGAKGEKRAQRKKATPEQMKKQNQYNREKLVLRKMRNNFKRGDLWITLKLKKGERVSAQEILKIREKFLRQLRGVYKKRGRALKYMCRIEIGERGGIHIHILVNRIKGTPGTAEVISQIWGRLKCGELTKPEVLVGRFREFFETEGICSDVAEVFNERYQLCLGDTIVFRDDSYEIVKSLRGKVKQYVVSNGTVVAQEKKLRLSGLGELMDSIFLSEALGVEKPNVEFFERMFETIGPVEKDQVLIVGDSLTSDIRGGNNAGIKTCWYNPNHKERYADVKIDYEIADLHEIYDIIGTGEWE